MKLFVVFNPVAGRRAFRNVRDFLIKELNKYGELFWLETKAGQVDFPELLEGNYDRVCIVGGDGTVSTVLSYMHVQGVKSPVVLLTQGSGNLLAHSLGLGLLPLKRQIKKGMEGEIIELDAMNVNGRLATVAVGRGYDTLLVDQTSRRSKRFWGLLAYGWAALRTILFYRSKHYKITLGSERMQVLAKMVVVVNTLPFFDTILAKWALGLELHPHDGELNLFVCRRWFKWEHYHAKSVVIKSKHERRFQMDGEVLKAKTLKVEVIPKAVKIVRN